MKPQEALQTYFGFESFRGNQEEVISKIVAGQDTLAVMPTGYGKSLCYQVPALCLPGLTIVVSPLIALMKDQVDFLQSKNIPASFLNSTLSPAEYTIRMEQIQNGTIKIVYIAPERFYSTSFTNALKQIPVSLFAIDEAHCISEWGHDFRPSYLSIKNVIPLLKNENDAQPTIAALTATATPSVREDIIKNLNMQNHALFVSGFKRDNLHLASKIVEKDDKPYLIKRILDYYPGAAIVYTGTRKKAEYIAEFLSRNYISAACYHAGLTKEDRDEIQQAFMENKFRCIVATNAFGMGIDKSDIRIVVHYDLPGTLEAYYQEVGRAGRDGQQGKCMLLYNKSDLNLRYFFLEAENPDFDVVKKVHEFLVNQPFDENNPIVSVSNKDITESISIPTNEMTISTVLKILEKEGHIKRHADKEQGASIKWHTSPSTILNAISNRAKSQRAVVMALADLYTLSLEHTLEFSVTEFCEAANLDKQKVIRALKAIEAAEHITFNPPHTGRQIEILSVDEFDMDENLLNQKRHQDYEKLDTLLRYIHTTDCRHKFILDYFEDDSTDQETENCGMCDNCKK